MIGNSRESKLLQTPPHMVRKRMIGNLGNPVEKRYEKTANIIDDDIVDNDGIDDDDENDDKDDDDVDDDIDDDADREVDGSCDDVNTNGFQETTQIQHANHLPQEAQLLQVDTSTTVQHSNSKGFTDDSATIAAKLEEENPTPTTGLPQEAQLPSDVDEVLRNTLATGPAACSTTAVRKLSVLRPVSVALAGRKLSGGLAVSFPSDIPFITPLCHTFRV